MIENMVVGGEFVGFRVMVIDDLKIICRIVEILFKCEGCEVVIVIDGFEVLVKIVD